MDKPANYIEHKSKDPFPEIPAALLNSADIQDYSKQVTLLDPFDVDRLKSASYEIPFAGTVYIWNQATREKEITEIGPSDQKSFTILPNSIAYIYLATAFWLPDYIAVRFNLKITHVHRGLLLGTGPLVDPGFFGRLLVPLHNLTSNAYQLDFGQGLIWVEFTKVSPNPVWKGKVETTKVPRLGQFRPFPDRKEALGPEQYFDKANRGNPIISSIPTATQHAKDSAKAAQESSVQAQQEARSAQKRAEEIRDRVYGIGWLAVAGIVVALVGLIYGGYQLSTAVNTNTQAGFTNTQASINYVKTQSADLTRHIEQTNAALSSRISKLEADLERLKDEGKKRAESKPSAKK